jgi:hypothetical protein
MRRYISPCSSNVLGNCTHISGEYFDTTSLNEVSYRTPDRLTANWIMLKKKIDQWAQLGSNPIRTID